MTADQPEPEIEVKMLAPGEAVLRALARLRAIGPYRLEPKRAQRLHSIYLDTDGLRLARHGVALRLRRDRSAWELTAKWSGRVHADLHERPELNVAMPSRPEIPFVLASGELWPWLAAIVRQSPLVPILVTHLYRRRFDVFTTEESSAPDSLAEIALDTVRLRPPRSASTLETYWEVEIERRSATPDQLTDLGRLLRDKFHLTPSDSSKFGRGLSALGVDLGDAQQGGPVRLGDTVEAASCKIVAKLVTRLLASDPGARLGENPEAVHDMRVATRRLRSVVRVFTDSIPARTKTPLKRDLKWLGRKLGNVRDMDVQLSRLGGRHESRKSAGAPGMRQLCAHIEEERTARRAVMLAALNSPRYFRFLDRLERFAQANPHDRFPAPEANVSVVAMARRSIRKAARNLARSHREVARSASAADLHRVRIAAKRFRYLLEFMREITGPAGRRLVKNLVLFQDLLGEVNDAEVAARLIQGYRQRDELSDVEDTALLNLAEAQRQRGSEAQRLFHRAWKRYSVHHVNELEGVLEHLALRGGGTRPPGGGKGRA